MASILVIEDNDQLRAMLQSSLERDGYEVTTADTGERGLELATHGRPDVVVLDLRLPGLQGEDVITSLRRWSSAPILVLSGADAESMKIAALDAGADDYITKPVGLGELSARVRALLRRSAPLGPALLRFDDLEVDLADRRVRLAGALVKLTRTEFELLAALAASPGRLMRHEELLRRVWGPGYRSETHYLRVFVRNLRSKLGDNAEDPRLIATEPGVGYRWIAEPSTGAPRA